MSDQTIVEYCSPTLAGIKTGSLFSCEYSDRDQVTREIRRLNELLGRKGIRAIPVRYSRGRVLVYLYRPDFLKRDFASETATKLLKGLGYKVESPDICIVSLINRLAGLSDVHEFPHEIGLFLGYPPEDVLGFIRNKGECPKCVGCWKVYGDRKKAERTFQMYDLCTSDYAARFRKGATLDKLAVKVPGTTKKA